MQEHLNVITFRLCGLIVSIDDVRAMHLLKNASGVNGWRNRSIIRQNKRLGIDGNKREKRFDLDGYVAKVALLTELSIVCNVRKTWFRWKCTVLFVNKRKKRMSYSQAQAKAQVHPRMQFEWVYERSGWLHLFHFRLGYGPIESETLTQTQFQTQYTI